MSDKQRDAEFIVGSVVCVVFGCVILANIPHNHYTHNVDFSDWQPWVGGALLAAGICVLVLKKPWEKH